MRVSRKAVCRRTPFEGVGSVEDVEDECSGTAVARNRVWVLEGWEGAARYLRDGRKEELYRHRHLGAAAAIVGVELEVSCAGVTGWESMIPSPQRSDLRVIVGLNWWDAGLCT